MQIDLKIEDLASVRDHLARLSGPQIREAYAKALTDVGFELRRKMQSEIQSVFDRPTPYVVRSPQVEAATSENLTIAVGPDVRNRERWASGGNGGVSPQKILQAQEWGGTRSDKRSEVVLRRVGILPAGFQTVIPELPYPGSDDGRGNLRGAFLQRILSYFQMFSEQGSKGNMKAKAKAKFEGARKYTDLRTRKERVARDQRFFLAGSRMESRFVGGQHQHGRVGIPRTAHLAPGIWAVAGDGQRLQPVLMFVKRPTYQPRLSMERVVQQTDTREYFDRRMRYRIRQALGE